MANGTLPGIISSLQQQGIFEIYLPFLLTFSIFYALIRKTGVFGDYRGASIIIAGVAASYVIVFSPAAIPIGQFFATFFAQASVGLVTLLVFIMVIGLLAGPLFEKADLDEKLKAAAPWIIGVGFLVVLGMFISSGGVSLFTQISPPGLGLPGLGLSGEDIAIIVLILVTVGVIAFIALTEGKERQPSKIEIPLQKNRIFL